jgi:hypothetical protein
VKSHAGKPHRSRVPLARQPKQSRAECVSVEVVTNGLRGCKQSGAPYEVAFVRRDGEFFMLLIASRDVQLLRRSGPKHIQRFVIFDLITTIHTHPRLVRSYSTKTVGEIIECRLIRRFYLQFRLRFSGGPIESNA